MGLFVAPTDPQSAPQVLFLGVFPCAPCGPGLGGRFRTPSHQARTCSRYRAHVQTPSKSTSSRCAAVIRLMTQKPKLISGKRKCIFAADDTGGRMSLKTHLVGLHQDTCRLSSLDSCVRATLGRSMAGSMAENSRLILRNNHFPVSGRISQKL